MLCEWIGALGKWVQKKILILSPKIHAAENNVKKIVAWKLNYCRESHEKWSILLCLCMC